MRFEFHPDALAEYEEAARHYAACQAGLELRFIGTVEHAIHLILDAPDKWSIFEADILSRSCTATVNLDIGASVLLEIRSATSPSGRIIARQK